VVDRYGSGGPWEDRYGYSRVVVAGPFVLVAGTTATDQDGVRHVGDAHGQALYAFRAALAALEKAGARVEDVVRTRMYVVGVEHADAVGRAHGELFGAVRPVSTLVMVERLIRPEHLVEIEVEAYLEAYRES
jgi:enamine deaminase RidA (YjgF/YER057c/UK114 family)